MSKRLVPALLLPLILSFTSCQAMLTPEQRQQLETRIYETEYSATFGAARDVLINQGFEIRASDFAGGILQVQTTRKKFSGGRTTLAFVGSFLLPPVGDAMMDRGGGAVVVDILTWPLSILWAPWINLHHGISETKAVTGNLAFDRLGLAQTRLRISMSGVPWDVTHYPREIRRLQDLIGRQLLLKKADRLGEPAPPVHPAPLTPTR